MQRKLSTRFLMQKVIELQLFKKTFEQNIESQHQSALAYVDDTGINSPGVDIGKWV